MYGSIAWKWIIFIGPNIADHPTHTRKLMKNNKIAPEPASNQQTSVVPKPNNNVTSKQKCCMRPKVSRCWYVHRFYFVVIIIIVVRCVLFCSAHILWKCIYIVSHAGKRWFKKHYFSVVRIALDISYRNASGNSWPFLLLFIFCFHSLSFGFVQHNFIIFNYLSTLTWTDIKIGCRS